MERVELHCHSIYSEQDGVSRIKDIIEFATANNMPAVAITDHASVAGYREAAYYGSHHEGLKDIYGIEYHNLDNLYWFDILTNTHINMIYQLINKTGVNVADISLDDFEVGMLLGGKGQISSLGIPEFDNEYARSAAKELEVESFSDVVQLVCLMHGTSAWENNAQELLHQENMSKDNIIASREDVFDCLIVLGFTREDAFEIAEFVRKGKARSVDKKWQSYKRKMEDAGAPDWFIASCEKVRYLFPRAHSYIYALHAWWSAWFKLHYPKEFYEVYIEIKASNGLKQIVNQGKSAFEIYNNNL